MSWPTDEARTAAVEAAGEALFESLANDEAKGSWSTLQPIVKHYFRDKVLPIVEAGLQALPDPRKTAWLEGLYCGLRQGYEDDNPYEEDA
jgi:hypothetical protein